MSNSVASVSRRRILAAAVTAGAGVAAVSVVGIASARENGADDRSGYAGAGGSGAGGSGAGGSGAGADGDSAIIVHVRSLAAGRLEVFAGARRFEIRDRNLARQLARAAGQR